jgi:hypothetical protein
VKSPTRASSCERRVPVSDEYLVLTKTLSACREILAGDKTILRELLHPSRDPAARGSIVRKYAGHH